MKKHRTPLVFSHANGFPAPCYASWLNDLRVPAGFIGGRDSEEVQRIGVSAMRGHFRLKRVEGSHMFPFEHPLQTAQAIRAMIETLLADKTRL